MAIQPVEDYHQRQRLTTTLKNICRDYPAGGTVLRELLQNADDAGATIVKFVLDDNTHPTNLLIHPDLDQYQGPALLAYNNATFRDKDFTNLSNIGDSFKIEDGLTTGKFGRGFNSVYNWTDSPSIVSRDRLLILDPHFRWSKGGPAYDFVANAEDPAIQNHMAAFKRFLDDPMRSLDGTVIRIPLRTSAQAKKSEISSRETTVSEVRHVLDTFGTEFGNDGLLFMRNIEELEIEAAVGKSLQIKLVGLDGASIKLQRSPITTAVKAALKSDPDSFNYAFDAVMERTSAKGKERAAFTIHHTISSRSMDPSLGKWAREQALIPWVAVAAQHRIPENFQGSMYSVLPLPIKSGQPVHIHGLFSISPDRARLYHINDTGMQDKHPALWNQWLFNGPIIEAWAKLLEHISLLPDIQPSFDWWPRSSKDQRDPLNDALTSIIESVKLDSLCLFPTNIGYKSSCLIDAGNESVSLKVALEQAKIPVAYVPQRYREIFKDTFGDRILSPQTLCNYISGWNDDIGGWSSITKKELLEYLTSDPKCWGYDHLALFPFEDGCYRPIKGYSAFIHRDNTEKDLFQLDGTHNIDLTRISVPTIRSLRTRCKNSTTPSSISFRLVTDLGDYFLRTVFKGLPLYQDMVELDAKVSTLALKAWKWIVEQQHSIQNGILNDALSNLFLIPLENGQFRKIRPNNFSEIIIANADEAGNLVRKLFKIGVSSNIPPLKLGSGGLAPEEQILLTNTAARHPDLRIMDSGDTFHLARWLNRNAATVAVASEEEKESIIKLISTHLSFFSTDCETIGDYLKSLKIFRRIPYIGEETQSRVTETNSSLLWVSLDDAKTSIGSVDGIIHVPKLDGIQILHAPWGSHGKVLLEKAKLANCKNIVSIIEENIIPVWGTAGSSWSYSCKEQVARLIFSQYSSLTFSSKGELRSLDIVPISTRDGRSTLKFARACKLIDCTNSELTRLFYLEEEVYPTEKFLQDFRAVLIDCGLKTTVDEDVINTRIRAYAESKRPLLETYERVQLLVRSDLEPSRFSSHENLQIVRQLKWLPAVNSDGNLVMKAPEECRSINDTLLVNFLLPVFETDVSSQWETRLGWNNNVPNDILLAQLSMGLQREEQGVINAVLAYIDEKKLTNGVIEKLMKMQCVLTTGGAFLLPSKVFTPKSSNSLTGYDGLHPYLGNVDRSFYRKHKNLLTKLGMKKDPSPNDLLDVQSELEKNLPLTDSDKDVAIEILKIATYYPRDQIVGLKVLTKDGDFCPIENACYHHGIGEVGLPPDIRPTHPDIHPTIIRKLEIENLNQQLIQGILEISDSDDEEEFEQREQITTRISDTLERYPVETTFREYLANADDAGASEINWLLDERSHPDERLLTPELKRHQGPALLAHNDSVFSEDDFKGFKNVGEGSKRQNKDAIGQFGRGAQTMYHWTDVPMILSGKFLIILDPQQEVLPKNRTRLARKPGVKVLLSKLRNLCPDQLAPFDKLWNYTADLGKYDGTIFRFPLRQDETHSKLKVTNRNINGIMIRNLMDTYFHEARISLLFLRKIRSIEFAVYGDKELIWHINRENPFNKTSRSYSGWEIYSVANHAPSGPNITGQDTWWISVDELQSENQLSQRSNRVRKQRQCGVAALIRTSVTGNSKQKVQDVLPPQLFSTLPLSIPSDLPVYLNGTFLLSGDRQSLVTNEFGQETQVSNWNQDMLMNAIPNLYLSFLESLARRSPETVMDYWPQTDPPKRSSSELICKSFWEKVPKSPLLLFPEAQLQFSLDKLKLLSITQATFDFLSEVNSNILAPLLLSRGVTLVRGLPYGVVKYLKPMKEVNSISGSTVRELFKTDISRIILQNHIRNDSRILSVLWGLAIPDKQNLDKLDACCFLPLENGSLGSLRLLSSSTWTTTYYIATKKEIELFQFASAVLVSENVKGIFENILLSKRFNLKTFELAHVKELLKYKLGQSSLPSKEETEWVERFWKYWNEKDKVLYSVPQTDIDDFELYQATCNGTSRLVKRSYLDDMPSVVEPLPSSADRRLCEKIPGLNIFSRTFMPKSLGEEEASFSYKSSFTRFIKALVTLAKQDRKSLGAFVKTHFDLDDLKVLRAHIIHHSNAIDSNSLKGLFEFKDDLRSIPLWPSCASASSSFVCAKDAWIVQDPKLLVPWMKNREQFVDLNFAKEHKQCMQKMGITRMPLDDLLNYILPLPSSLSDEDWQCYLSLISKLQELLQSHEKSLDTQRILSRKNIAVDGNRNFVKADNLYDHTEPIYMSALQGVAASSFLHSKVCQYREFWIKIGLRHRINGFMQSEDYIRCLQEILKRYTTTGSDADTQLNEDYQRVLSPLISNPALCNFSRRDWEDISRMEVFLCQTDNFTSDPVYRRDAMAAIAVDQPPLRLSRIILRYYAPVCWSQVLFPIHQPSGIALERANNDGKPPVETVWKHLKFLSKRAQHLQQTDIQDFLTDLHHTYVYLQTHSVEHSAESRALFTSSIRDNDPIWLNINWQDGASISLDDVKSEWSGLKNLVLSSSCDRGEIKAVRSSLMRYETLLKTLGCKWVVYPTAAPPSCHQDRSVSTSLRKLRKEGKLLDVTFIARGGRIRAHKLVLAAISEKCERQFSSRWQNENEINCDDDDNPDESLSYHTLSTMIDYAYEDQVDWREMQVQDGDDEDTKKKKLDMLFDLHKGADYWLISELKSQVECEILTAGKEFLTIKTAEYMLERATEVRASATAAMCRQFIMQNQEIFQGETEEDGN